MTLVYADCFGHDFNLKQLLCIVRVDTQLQYKQSSIQDSGNRKHTPCCNNGYNISLFVFRCLMFQNDAQFALSLSPDELRPCKASVSMGWKKHSGIKNMIVTQYLLANGI